ncbi:carboxylesterase/lipase family protein [Clostridium neuense]|uniref:Carboxylic ester hydrolase n=1 Tax=Clostridium neuense TaxID=1728934 RepID=A0ABW8TJ32_9CLOT
MFETIVNTLYGEVKGERIDGISIWKGIPYAAPPVGSLRFCPPNPPSSWDGIRDASKFGKSAMQPEKSTLIGDKSGTISEDCLYLNIWSPNADDKLRPVMVWIHGGGFIAGSGYDGIYDGTSFAKEGNVVIVTLNYRLGAFGFLYLKEIAGEKYSTSGNCGLLDQIAALKWVKENIKAFGGDPNKITIFGESAGAASIGNLLAMPAAKGLFNQAIIESTTKLAINSATASKATNKLINLLGIEKNEFEKLIALPADKLVKASLTFPMATFRPVIDNVSIPEDPEDLLRKGAAKNIPIICGSNKDEFALFSAANPSFDQWDEKEILTSLEKQFGTAWPELYKYFSKEKIDKKTYNRIMSYYSFIYPTLKYSEILSTMSPVWVYKFSFEHPVLGAFHSSELQYVWNKNEVKNINLFKIPPQGRKLAKQMHHAWIAFAHNGNPNANEIPYWPGFEVKDRAVMVFNDESRVEYDPYEDRKIWEKISERNTFDAKKENRDVPFFNN